MVTDVQLDADLVFQDYLEAASATVEIMQLYVLQYLYVLVAVSSEPQQTAVAGATAPRLQLQQWPADEFHWYLLSLEDSQEEYLLFQEDFQE